MQPNCAPDPLADDPDADLLRRIYLSPEDDAPRAAYAVVLAAREDPRGEFIALQLARARGESVAAKRASQLLAKHAAQWGSPILDEVDRQAFCRTWDDARSVPAKRYGGVRFERGFLSHVSMFRNTLRTAGYFVLVGLHEDDPSPVGDGGGRSIPRYYDSLTAGIAEKLAAVADRVSVEIRPPDEVR